MINRQMILAELLSYNGEPDEYGQMNTGEPTSQPIELTLTIYNHSKVEDVRFNNVTHTALTKNKEVTDANKIRIGENMYLIEFVNPDGRLAQLFLKKEK